MTNITEETAISNEEVILGWQSQQWNIIIIICVRSIYVSKTHQPYNESKSNKILPKHVLMFYFCVKENTKYKTIIYKSSQIKVQSIEHLKNIFLIFLFVVLQVSDNS